MTPEKAISPLGAVPAAGIMSGTDPRPSARAFPGADHARGRRAPATGLKRELELFSLTNIVVANMIGAGVLTLIKIAGIILFVAAGFAFGRGDFSHLFEGRGLNFSFSQCKSIGLSFLWIMFAYSGWNASAYIGSEIRTPKKNLPRSLILGTALVTLLYLALNLLYVYAVPLQDISGTASIGGLAAAKLFGRSLEQLVSLFIAFALFSSLSAYIMLGPRVYFSMARDGCFFNFAARVHPRYKTPYQSIVFQGLIAAVMVLVGSFDQLLTYLGFALAIFPILAVIGVCKLRRRGMAKRLTGYPFTPAFFILTSFAMLAFSFLERPLESLVAIATLLLGIPLYFLVFRRNKNEGL